MLSCAGAAGIAASFFLQKEILALRLTLHDEGNIAKRIRPRRHRRYMLVRGRYFCSLS